MPFVAADGASEPLGAVGSGLPAATMVVDPDKILQLKGRLEDRREKVIAFMTNERRNLAVVPSPGTGPCSEGAAEALGQNGQLAMDALNGFVTELTNVIDVLNESAQLYGLVDEANAAAFQQVSQ